MRKFLTGLLLVLTLLPLSALAQGSSDYQPGSSIGNTPGTSSMNAEDRKVYNYIQDVRLTVQQLTKRQEYKKAHEYFSRMNAMLDNSKMTSRVRNELISSIHRNELVGIYMAQGDYKGAENAIYTAIKYNDSPEDKAILEKIKSAQQAANNGSGNPSGVENPIGMPNPIPNPNLYDRRAINYIQDVRKTVQNLTRERKFKEAQKHFSKMKSVLNNNKMSDFYRNRLTASIHRNELANIYSRQAEYQQAANAIRTAIKHDKNVKDMEKLLKTQEKVGLQRELFKMRKQHQKDMLKLQEQKSAYLNAKLAVLRQYNTGKPITDVDLKNIQKELKAINVKLNAVNKNIQATQSRYQKSFQRIWQQGVVLTEKQREEVYKLAAPRQKLQRANYQKAKEIAKKLSEISQNTEITWEGLKENFQNLMTLQDKMYSLRKDLHGISQNLPLTEEQYAAAKKLRAELEKLMQEAEKLMQKVEDAFVDTKTFAKLTLKEKLAFVRMFSNVWQQDKEFNSMKPSLDDIYSKIFDSPIIIGPMPTPEPGPVPPTPGYEVISGRGFIVKSGSGFLLLFNDKFYAPTNLPARYSIHDLGVKFTGEISRLYRTQNIVSNADGSDDKYASPFPRVDYGIYFTSISAPQLPDQPYENRGGQTATASEVIEENIENQDQPSNLMNAF